MASEFNTYWIHGKAVTESEKINRYDDQLHISPKFLTCGSHTSIVAVLIT
jgi:hypothetical protein